MRILAILFCALAFATSAQAQSDAMVHQWLVNACMASGGDARACDCYAGAMLSVASPYDRSEMLAGRITPNMERADPEAKARCGIR
jgi:hypothetical protein